MTSTEGTESSVPLVQLSAHRHATPAVFPGSPFTSHGCRKTHPRRVHDPANLHIFSPAPGIAVGSAAGGVGRTIGIAAEAAGVEVALPFFCEAETCDFGQSCGGEGRGGVSYGYQGERSNGATHGILTRELLLARFTRKNESALLGRNGRGVRVRARRLGAVDAVLADLLLERLCREGDGGGWGLQGSVRGLVRRTLVRLLVVLVVVLSRRRPGEAAGSSDSGAEVGVEGGVEGGGVGGEALDALLAGPVLHGCEGLGHGGLRHERVDEGGLLRMGEGAGSVAVSSDVVDCTLNLEEREISTPSSGVRGEGGQGRTASYPGWVLPPFCTRSKMLRPSSRAPFRPASLRSPPAPLPFAPCTAIPMFRGPAGTPSKPGGRSYLAR